MKNTKVITKMQSKKAIKTYGFIVCAIMLSKLLGLVRDALMANFYGTGIEAAAFSAARKAFASRMTVVRIGV